MEESCDTHLEAAMTVAFERLLSTWGLDVWREICYNQSQADLVMASNAEGRQMRTSNVNTAVRVGHRGRIFTLVEMLMVVAIIGILMALLLPMLREAKIQAKFVRWVAFNRNCSNDPTCVVNFNFQGNGPAFSTPPPGDVLINSASGSQNSDFKPELYNGYLKNNNDPSAHHNFEWVRSGRFGRYKWALRFNGADTYVVMPGTKEINFTPYTSFTVLCWLKFDKMGLGDCPFSKSLWGTASDASCQYDLYAMPWSGQFGQGSFDVDVFTTCGTWPNTEVDFDKAGWVHLALRYKYLETNASGDAEGEITVFINGKALGNYINITSQNPYTAAATEWKTCADLSIPLILGGAGCYRKYWSASTWDPNDTSLANTWVIKFLFQGLMDEFLVYKRALSDGEIKGHYDMGKP